MALQAKNNIYAGNVLRKSTNTTVQGEYVSLLDDTYYCIRNYDALDPFFITVVSSSNHWLFISTTGGLSAGRIDANHALFPYYTVDKITENHENTGAKTLLLITSDTGQLLWEPFSNRNSGVYQLERNLYKNVSGTSIVFEEVNHDLNLTYRYAWRTSEAYGFVKTSYLMNQGNSDRQIKLLDGLQNILPAHATVDVQNEFSNLLDAYKFNELHPTTGLGMFSLSSRLTDLAEPSESLRTNIVWQVGLENVRYLLSSSQLNAFRNGSDIFQEAYIRGKRGAYFAHAELVLQPHTEHKWHHIADVEQDSTQATNLVKMLTEEKGSLFERVENNIKDSQSKLDSIVAQADGQQISSDTSSVVHHFANVLFNVMRGGIFARHYMIDKEDLQRFILVHRPALLQRHSEFFETLPTHFRVSELREKADNNTNPDLIRLCYSYLPLTFSRRHGDPSRPWNKFQINVTQADGSQRLDYQGNWRDIFQNWEALSYSYPEFIHGMISVFLNATTVDGYNPYRVTRDGIDWESPEPTNAWANIGYWNDHQIIYLQKLLEVCERFYPNELDSLLNRRIFSYANVPYQIKPYDELIKNPYNTITFNWDEEEKVKNLVQKIGADGKLVHDVGGNIVYASLAEKLLLLLLVKLSNFVPEGGIWLNTQRPEWNDANNALVGKGLSVVTLAYMRRYVMFFSELLKDSDINKLIVSQDINTLFKAINAVFGEHRSVLEASISDEQRRIIIDKLGMAGSNYRWQFYENGISNEDEHIARTDIIDFLQLAQAYIDHSLRANKRQDNLYHTYNTLQFTNDSAKISNLSLMLEGQVAILSSGLLEAEEALTLLETLRNSDLYRRDQHSYILYPDRQLPGFLEKNIINADAVRKSKLISTMQQQRDFRLLSQDINDRYHFQGNIRNANDVAKILTALEHEPDYAEIVKAERNIILELFEQVFNHAAFTGRSGTFFAYEGLGSIYWHMISKLLLAVQEAVINAVEANADTSIVQSLKARYEDVRAGIGFNKSPDVYGAFPTDPYSHTPMGQGAKQPGMTGMVKEEILTRLVELGIVIEDGTIVFNPTLFREQELLESASLLPYIDIQGAIQQLDVPAGALAFTVCQIPILVQQGDANRFEVHYADERVEVIMGHRLDANISQEIFSRNGTVRQVILYIS